jgi:hypothetical protein
MSHDQLSKSLIETFFADFLHLILPRSAERLRLDQAIFLDKEIFKDWPEGERRELDLLARVPVEEEDLHLLIHVEIETEARSGMGERLWRYYMQIRLRHELLVLPVLVNLRGGRPGIELEILEEGFEPLPTGVFRYRALGLSGCRAEDWLIRPEPVAWAFAALMRSGSWSRAELKIECLRRIEQSDVTGWRKQVLVNWIETYVQLSGEDAAEFLWLLELDENRRICEMELTWLGQAEARGLERGRSEGLAEAIERMRRLVLLRIEQRFGTVPGRVQKKVLAIDSVEPLVEMIERLPLLTSVEDLVPRRDGPG